MLAIDKPEIMYLFLEHLSLLGFYADIGSPGCYGKWNQHYRFTLSMTVFLIAAFFIHAYENTLPKWKSMVVYAGKVRSGTATRRLPTVDCDPYNLFHSYGEAWQLGDKRTFRAGRDLLFMMVFPSVLGYCVSVMSCEAGGLASDPSVKCEGSWYWFYALLGGFLLIIVGLCVPLYLSNMIYRLVSRNKYQETVRAGEEKLRQEYTWMERLFFRFMEWLATSRSGDVTNAATDRLKMIQDGFFQYTKSSLFLIEEYSVPYFGVWSMIRKTLMVVALLFNMSLTLQLVILLIVNCTHLAILLRYRPYIHMSVSHKPSRIDLANHLEQFLTIVIVTILLLFLMLNVKTAAYISVIFVIVIGSITFIGLVIIMYRSKTNSNRLRKRRETHVSTSSMPSSSSRDAVSTEEGQVNINAFVSCQSCDDDLRHGSLRELRLETNDLHANQGRNVDEKDSKENEDQEENGMTVSILSDDEYNVLPEFEVHRKVSTVVQTNLVADRPIEVAIKTVLLDNLNHLIFKLPLYIREFLPVHEVTLIPKIERVEFMDAGVSADQYEEVARWWTDKCTRPLEETRFAQEALKRFNKKNVEPQASEYEMKITATKQIIEDRAETRRSNCCVWCDTQIREEKLDRALRDLINHNLKSDDAFNCHIPGLRHMKCLSHIPCIDELQPKQNAFILLKRLLKLRRSTLASLRRFLYFQHRDSMDNEALCRKEKTKGVGTTRRSRTISPYAQLEEDELHVMNVLLSQWVDFCHVVYMGIEECQRLRMEVNNEVRQRAHTNVDTGRNQFLQFEDTDIARTNNAI